VARISAEHPDLNVAVRQRWARSGNTDRRILNASTPQCVAVCDGGRFWPGTAVLIRSGCVGFEPYRAEVVSRGQAHVGVEGGGQVPQEGDGGLGAALFDALDLIDGHVSAPG